LELATDALETEVVFIPTNGSAAGGTLLPAFEGVVEFVSFFTLGFVGCFEDNTISQKIYKLIKIWKEDKPKPSWLLEDQFQSQGIRKKLP
jgi:hypothetical protein